MLEKPWMIKHKRDLHITSILLFTVCILTIFLGIILALTFRSALFVYCWFFLFMGLSASVAILGGINDTAARFGDILSKLQNEVTWAKISGLGLVNYVLTCETLNYGKFSLKFYPRYGSLRVPAVAHPYYKLWISTYKQLPQLNKIFTRKNGLSTSPQNKILTDKLMAIESLKYIGVEKRGNENRLVARFRTESFRPKTSFDIIEYLKILREIEATL